MKKLFLTCCVTGLIVFVSVGFDNIHLDEQENEIVQTIGIEDAYYYDLMTDDEGNLFALANTTDEDTSRKRQAIVWQSSDQGDTWEKLLFQPERLKEGSELKAGALREEKEGVEAFAVFTEYQDKTREKYTHRLYRINSDGYEEMKADKVLEQLGDGLWNISFVNDHILSLGGGEECVLYDIKEQKPVKKLSYNLYSVGFLPIKEQFLIYGKDLSYCLDAENLEEEKAEESLQEFIAEMYKKNGSDVFPPMDTEQETIVCVTKEAVYEYKNGKTQRVLPIPETVNERKFFNGMMPVCKGEDGVYYVSVLGAEGGNLQKIEMK